MSDHEKRALGVVIFYFFLNTHYSHASLAEGHGAPPPNRGGFI